MRQLNRQQPAKIKALLRSAGLCTLDKIIPHNFLMASFRLVVCYFRAPIASAMNRLIHPLRPLGLMLALTLCSATQARTPESPDASPEAATAPSPKTLVRAKRWMVASANPLATEEIGRAHV